MARRFDPRADYETPAAHERIGVRSMAAPRDSIARYGRAVLRAAEVAANSRGARSGETVVVAA